MDTREEYETSVNPGFFDNVDPLFVKWSEGATFFGDDAVDSVVAAPGRALEA